MPAAKADKSAKINSQIYRLLLTKAVWGIDAIALSLAVFLILLILPALYPYIPNVPQEAPLVIVILSLIFTAIALVGNFIRCRKIQRLEKLLD